MVLASIKKEQVARYKICEVRYKAAARGQQQRGMAAACAGVQKIGVMHKRIHQRLSPPKGSLQKQNNSSLRLGAWAPLLTGGRFNVVHWLSQRMAKSENPIDVYRYDLAATSLDFRDRSDER